MRRCYKTTSLLVVDVIILATLCTGARADFVFGQPQDLGLGSGAYVSVSADELELYFTSTRSGGLGNEDLWVTSRPGIHDSWGPPVNLQALNSDCREAFPSISLDGLTLYFSDFFYGPDRPGGMGGHDLWMSTRASRADPWGTPVNMKAPFNSTNQDVSPTISHDGLTFIFASDRSGGSGGYDLWTCTRPSLEDSWGPPVNMGSTLNSGSHDYCGNLSPDGRVLFFESNRGGDYAGWVTIRESIEDPWAPPTLLPAPLATMGAGCVAPDGMSFYSALSEVPIVPLLDFNGDGQVDSTDMGILINYWGTDVSFCDVGPMPWGDGIIDDADIEVLLDHMRADRRLLTYWKLDEAEGTIAHDSVSGVDAVVLGDAAWQPDAGKIRGALALDGTDDYLETDFILNPKTDALRLFVWVKGEAPGQAIVSQAGVSGYGSTWLGTDASRGTLTTGLIFGNLPLSSDAVITDGQWHEVGVSWDGSVRQLHVDGVVVGRDQARLSVGFASCRGGLHIGCGPALEPETFFLGLIDDIRIYNRAIRPMAR